MKNKKLWMIPLLSLFFIMMSSLALGYGGAVRDFSTGNLISGAVTNFTLELPATFNGTTNCNATIVSVGGLTNVSTRYLINATNGSTVEINAVSDLMFNRTITFNSNAVQDVNDYNLSFICSNRSGDYYQFVNLSNIIVDNTLPTAPSSLTSAEQTSDDFTISATVTESNTVRCRLEWISVAPTSGVDPSVASSSGTCSFSIADASDGEYSYKVHASDRSNETQSATQKIMVNTEIGVKPPIQPTLVKEVAPSREGILAMLGKFISWLRNLFN